MHRLPALHARFDCSLQNGPTKPCGIKAGPPASPVPPDAGRIALDQLVQRRKLRSLRCLAGRTPVAVVAPVAWRTGRALRIAPEAELRGDPCRQAIVQADGLAPIDLAREGLAARDIIIRGRGAGFSALPVAEAEHRPWIDDARSRCTV